MRLLFGLVFALVICVTLVGAAASAVGAQEPVPVDPPYCRDMSHVDLNGDGKINGEDFTMWVYTVHDSGRCELDGPLGDCPAWIDVNRDGVVSHADLEVMIQFMYQCILAPRPFVDR